MIPDDKKRVLVLDDQIDIIDAYGKCLESQFKVTKTNSPFEAISFLKEAYNGIDLVILDVKMPGMSGLEFLSNMAEIRCSTPVILCSGEIVDPLPPGVFSRLVKPVCRQVLLEEANKAINAAASTRPDGQPFLPDLAKCVAQLESLLMDLGCAEYSNLSPTMALDRLGPGKAYDIFCAWYSMDQLRKRYGESTTEEPAA